MPTLARGMQFTEQGWCYLLAHDGWEPAPVPTPLRAPSLWVRCGLDTAESQRDTRKYLERKKNTAPGADGCVGYDLSASMWNERLNSYAAGLPDAFVLFDWQANNRATKLWADEHPTNPFGPWGTSPYPNAARNDQTLDIAGIAQRVGPNPGAIENSPYWEMRANGVPVHDLPVPPQSQWVSPLPPPGLKVGDAGTPTNQLGLWINQLQRRLAFEGRWPNPPPPFNWYYGTKWVQPGVASAARDLTALGLYDGPVDGRVFSAELHVAWDGALRYTHMIGRA